MSQLTEVTLETLPLLENGKIAVAFNRLLQAAAEDCDKRPGDPKARLVTITANVTPVLNSDGSIDKVDTEFVIAGKNPPMRSQPLSFRLHRGGKLSCNLDSPANVDQGTFPMPRDDD